MKPQKLRRRIRIHYNNGSPPLDLELVGVSSLDARISHRSLFINESKPDKFHMCYSESLFPDFTNVESLEIVRDN